jgi:predicted unusual protein kinase regulating ubiquinone biosynthesis (AarF/ABC1/UbiB family)
MEVVIVGSLVALALWAYLIYRLTTRRSMSKSVAGRTGQIGALLTRSAFRKFRLRLKQVVANHEEKKRLESQYHVKTAEEAAKMMGQMKGVFMKIGQIISFTNESLPPEARKALASLQQSAPPMDFSLVREVLERELGKPLDQLFKHVDHEPLAAASIGQVHRAKLHDGTDVALKVQYPGVDEAIRSDLKASAGLAAMIGAVNRNLDAVAVVEELKEMILQELDYRQELRSQQLFGELWRDHPLIRVPKVYPQYSSQRVLCQEFKRGLRFNDFIEQANDKERKLAVRVLHDFVFDSMNRFCVFNGDPHPGNYLFHEDGGITFLDYGCIKYFEPKFIRSLQRMNRTLVEGDKLGFEVMCKEVQLVLPGRPYDIEKLWTFMRYNSEPVLEDKPFKFTSAWIRRASELMQPENTWQMNLPKDFLFFNRITFGLNSIFCQLGAEEHFHSFNRRYIYEDHQGAPSLALAGVQLPERYLSAKMEPAPHVLKEPHLAEELPAGVSAEIAVS